MKIEISIVEDDGHRRVVASNQQLMPEGPGGHRPRLWDAKPDYTVIRSMSATEHWATSHLLMHTAALLMVDPQHAPTLAAVSAYQAARREADRDEQAAASLKVQQGLLRAQERLGEQVAEVVRRGRTVAEHSRLPDDNTTAHAGLDGDLMFVRRGETQADDPTTEKKD